MATTSRAIIGPSALKGLHVGLWIAQIFVALVFLNTGMMKLITPAARLAAGMPHFPVIALRAIGLAEVLGAAGLILPSALRIAPWLTPLAAACLALLMVGAMGTHIVMNDAPGMIPALVLAVLCTFIAWGRTKKAPIK